MFKFLGMLMLISTVLAEDVDYHETLDDHFDFNAISLGELKTIAYCMIDQGHCEDFVYSWRKHYPHVVETACKRCNIDQMRILNVFLKRLKSELPEIYKTWRQMNDPEGKYFDTFEAAVAPY